MADRNSTFFEVPLGPRKIDHAGVRFGRLVAIRPMKREVDGFLFWECRCDCGVITTVHAANLGKSTRSCGCLCREAVSKAKRITGLALTDTYRIWRAMRDRSLRPGTGNYHRYGARGITCDPRWRSFVNFLADMGERPLGPTAFSLDRIDNNGNYCKENCRWATHIEQQNNKSDNVIVEFEGEQYTVAELARLRGMTHDQLYRRLRSGWSVDRAVGTPVVRR